jgi:hypothetical protein
MSHAGDAALMIAARAALLDALDALAGQREALVLIGAQAIYLHTGAADVALAEVTKDSDLAVDPEPSSTIPSRRRDDQGRLSSRPHPPVARQLAVALRHPGRPDGPRSSGRRGGRAARGSRRTAARRPAARPASKRRSSTTLL